MDGRRVTGMPEFVRSVVLDLASRFGSRAVLELENLAGCTFSVASSRIGSD